MSPRVSISLRAAKAWHEDMMSGRWDPALVRELEAAISKATRASKARALLAKPKRVKKAARRVETSAIREAVFARAGGHCELCKRPLTAYAPGELHHALGRAKAQQSEANCLALCRECHRDVTDSKAGARGWYTTQADAFAKLGYPETVRELRKKAAFAEAKSALVTARAGVAT